MKQTTRLALLARTNGTDARSACLGFTKKLRHVPAPLRKTLTYDRGKEMAKHERLAQRLAILILFTDPSARGSVAPTRTPMACCASTYQGHGLVALYPARVERHRPSPEYAPKKMSQRCHALESLYAPASLFTRCPWNLKPPGLKA